MGLSREEEITAALTKPFPASAIKTRQPSRDRVRVEVDDETGCHLWTGAVNQDGYGLLGRGSFTGMAHRWFWIERHGPIPDGMKLDHLCRNPRCVNPDHLEVVTNRENVMRGEGPTVVASRANVCLRGHPLSPENTIVKTDGSRQCRRCQRVANNRSYRRRQEARRGAIQS
jgi:hypothetical protein